jgi:glucose/arabinose dehydrogenase
MPGSDNRLHQSGGAILETLNTDNQIVEVYLTVGDFTKLGFSGEEISNQTRAILSSLIKIQPNGDFKIIASGFRNPQGIGLYQTPNGVFIIQTEHGPRGGDELNVVVEGNYYGWPTFSLGTQYVPNDPTNQPDERNTFGTATLPLFAWLPSIGPSKVSQVTSIPLREYWSDRANEKYGDILVAGMGSQTIYRLRVKDFKVIYVEPIYLGFRVRTMVETNTGEFIFGTDTGIKILKMAERWDNSGAFRKISDS